MSYNRNESKWKGKKGLIGIIVFLLLWLILSILKGLSPTALIGSIFSSQEDSPEHAYTKKQLYQMHLSGQATIDSLNGVIESHSEKYRQAFINIDSESLNMRDKPSLSSTIILQIPDSSKVDILFYDTQEFILAGKYGKWCRINYAGQEGWVWGNYLVEM